jgi:hypothetical protein
MVTIFKTQKDILKPNYISVDAALSRISAGKSEKLITQIRNEKDEVKRAELKKLLPSVVFAGECRHRVKMINRITNEEYETFRADKSVTSHSGFFVLDFDKTEPGLMKNQLREDPYIYACWVSPSGNGVKALVKCPPDIKTHGEYYTSFMSRYPQLDTTSRNISRLCYESYDPELYLNRNSKTWSVKISKEIDAHREQKIKQKGSTIIDVACNMVRNSADGEKHNTLLKASNLLGGYIATGRVDEGMAEQALINEIWYKNPKDINAAIKTIKDGIAHGKTRPLTSFDLYEFKKLERSIEYIKRDDGSYDFMADKLEMDAYEQAFIDGTLEMGKTTGIPELDKHWRVKTNTMVWFMGLDNTGKSLSLWYLAILSSMYNKSKILLYSAENGDGSVRKKLKELYIGKGIKYMRPNELKKAAEHIDSHFKIISSKGLFNWDDLIMRAEIIYDEGFEYDIAIFEPYNAVELNLTDRYSGTIKSLNSLRVFKEKYASCWIADHANTAAARNRMEDGTIKRPYKSDVEMGQMKANKTDDFIVIHRNTKDPETWNQTEIHVDKIKDTETGGKPTVGAAPIILTINKGMCGFICGDIDPVKQYWEYINKIKEIQF